MSNPVDTVTEAVEALGKALPSLLEACTDPEGIDVADLFAQVQDARKALANLERDAEAAAAKAMLGDTAESTTLRVERSRATDRKAWDHDGWRRDVRAKALQAYGLKGAQGILTAEGELVAATELHRLLTDVQDAAGSHPPKTTALRALGLDARDYCESSPGRWMVRVTRMADETKGGETDAA